MVIVLFWGTVYDIGFTWVYHIRISSASFEMLLPLLGWLCTVKNRCLVPYMAGCYQTISTNPLIRRSYMRTVYLLYIYNIIVIHNIVCIYNPFYYLYIYMYVCMYVYCIYLYIYVYIYINNIISPWYSHICWGPGNREKIRVRSGRSLRNWDGSPRMSNVSIKIFGAPVGSSTGHQRFWSLFFGHWSQGDSTTNHFWDLQKINIGFYEAVRSGRIQVLLM